MTWAGETKNTARDWLRLILAPGLGPASIHKLLAQLGDPAQILAADKTSLSRCGLNTEQVSALRQVDDARLDAAEAWLQASTDHHLLCIDDPDYPELLKITSQPPVALFVRGNIRLLSEWQLAIVGSRNPTTPGRETAHTFARHLAESGLLVTSGMALGIDAAAHEGALAAGKPTIAVMGNGLDRVYPAKHHKLAHRIAEQGALVSEYAPDMKPLAQNFPRRNRIISGLSLGTLVIEAALKSGSLITAYKALEQSREVFAIPGSIHNPLARGCHQLIRQGAKLVETSQDILEELGSLAGAASSLRFGEAADSTADTPAEASHRQVLQAMAYEPVSIDTLVERTGLPASAISSILLILELQGQVSIQSGGRYIQNS